MQVDSQAADIEELVRSLRMAHNRGWTYWSKKQVFHNVYTRQCVFAECTDL